MQYQNNQKLIIMQNWKMFGIFIGGFTIIPCFYDFERYLKNIKMAIKYRRRYVSFSTMWYRFECLFDTSKPRL